MVAGRDRAGEFPDDHPPKSELVKGSGAIHRTGTISDAIEKEMVDHPDHYNEHPSGVECIDVIEHMSFNCGNAVKYVWRSPHKGKRLEDLRKARWYLDREIELLSVDPSVNE